MATLAALLRKLDKRFTIVRRPGDSDPAAVVEDRYGNRIDNPAAASESPPDFVNCWGAAESRPTTGGELEEGGGRNAGSVNWTLDLEPDADIKRTDIIREYTDPDDYTSPVIHEWQIRSVDLVTTFKGSPSHWQIESTELS